MWKETPQRPQPQTMTHRHLQPSRLHSHWLHPHTYRPCNCTRVRRYGRYNQRYKPLLTNSDTITVFSVYLSMILYKSKFFVVIFTDNFQAMFTTALYWPHIPNTELTWDSAVLLPAGFSVLGSCGRTLYTSSESATQKQWALSISRKRIWKVWCQHHQSKIGMNQYL